MLYYPMLFEVTLLLFLILLNGLFALSEIAIVGSRRVRLLRLANDGSKGAARALQLAADPTRFLSSVQVGITSIGILSGAIGEATFAAPLAEALRRVPPLASYAPALSLAAIVIGLTYVSLILGELVPKRLALTRPEAIAALVARPMQLVALITRPLVTLLSASTDGILRVLRVRTARAPAVTPEEIKVLVEQGAAEGVFETTERELVTNVLELDERSVTSVMTPRSEIVFLNIRDPFERNRERLLAQPHSVVPVCDGTLDHVIGFVRSTDILEKVLAGEPVDLRGLTSAPLFVPHTVTVMRLLEHFRRTHLPLALVVDEFGQVDGLASLADVLAAIVGELPQEVGEEPRLIRREDGSWLVDGGLDVSVVIRALGAPELFDEARDDFHTVGGFVMAALGRVPNTGDVFERNGFRFEVVDMDGNRIDRVLVSRR